MADTTGDSDATARVRVIDPRELNDLLDLAARGGLGQTVATKDCVAESPDQLMYIAGDTLTLLREMGDIALASCEGVVGWIKIDREINFAPAASPSASALAAPLAETGPTELGVGGMIVPDTIVSSPTPPGKSVDLPPEDPYDGEAGETHGDGDVGPGLGDKRGMGTPDVRRASGPFDLGTPQYSPDISHVDRGFFEQQQQQQQLQQQSTKAALREDEGSDSAGTVGQKPMNSGVRASVLSTASSEALGGIGGFMMGVGNESLDISSGAMEELDDASHDSLTASTSTSATTTGRPPVALSQSHDPLTSSPDRHDAGTNAKSDARAETASPTSSRGRPESSDSWDIYGDYARDSMYYKRSTRDIRAMSGMDQAFNLAKALASASASGSAGAAVPPPTPPGPSIVSHATSPGPPVNQRTLSPRSRTRPRPPPLRIASPDSPDATSEAAATAGSTSPETTSASATRSIATELRLKIQREREEAQRQAAAGPVPIETDQSQIQTTDPLPLPMVPPRSSSRLKAAIGKTDADPGSSTTAFASSATTPAPALFITNAEETLDVDREAAPSQEAGNESAITDMSAGDMLESEQSTIIETPIDVVAGRPPEVAVEPTGAESTDSEEQEHEKDNDSTRLLASPIPIAELEPPVKLQTPQLSISPDPSDVEPYQQQPHQQRPSPSLRQGLSPDLSLPGSPFSPGSPASPHSITATRQAAAEISKSASATPTASGNSNGNGNGSNGGAGRITTLLGRTDDLLGSRGPVPITFHLGSPGGFRSSGPSTLSTPGSMSSTGGQGNGHGHGLGLGLPSMSMSISSKGRISPSHIATGGPRRATSPLISSPLFESPLMTDADSRFPKASVPLPSRNVSSPVTYTTPPMPPIPSPSPNANPDPAAVADDGAQPSSTKSSTVNAKSSPGFFPRARSRSFGATVAKAIGRGKKDKQPPPPPPPPQSQPSLAINTALSPKSANVPVPLPPAETKSQSSPRLDREPGRDKSRLKSPTAAAGAISNSPAMASASAPSSPRVNGNDHGGVGASPVSSPPVPLSRNLTAQSTDSARSAALSPHTRTPGSDNRAKPIKKGSTGISTGLASPVSHRDYAEETVKADGLDFELVQPKLKSPSQSQISGLSLHGHGTSIPPTSPALSVTITESPDLDDRGSAATAGTAGTAVGSYPERPGMNRSETLKSDLSGASARSLPLPETDEWGFIKSQSPTPEMFQSRSTASDHRAAEQKWLGIVATPLPSGTAIPKKVRKLAIESGVPASLRGKVWAWMLAAQGADRVSGLYETLSAHPAELDAQTEAAISSVYSDHSVFAGPTSTGTADLRAVLGAYSRRHPSPGGPAHLPMIGGMLLIHCVAEDAFRIVDGLLNGVMRDYFGHGQDQLAKGVAIDAAVFAGVLAGSEKAMSRKFKDLGVHPRPFIEKWYSQLFLRCLPWPTALRVLDALFAEGPRFLLVASLSILTLSRDRIMDLDSKASVLAYLADPPQDALLLPEHFMKACAEVKFRDEDYKRLRAGVQKEMMTNGPSGKGTGKGTDGVK